MTFQGDPHPCANIPLILNVYFSSRGGSNNRPFLCRALYKYYSYMNMVMNIWFS